MSIEITDMVCYAGSKDRFLCRVQRESEESGGYHGRKQKRIFLKRNECGDCSGDCRGGGDYLRNHYDEWICQLQDKRRRGRPDSDRVGELRF